MSDRLGLGRRGAHEKLVQGSKGKRSDQRYPVASSKAGHVRYFFGGVVVF